MYGLAYVLLPKGFGSLQDALDRTLKPFERGGIRKFPKEKLAFEDWTDDARMLHQATASLEPGETGGHRLGGIAGHACLNTSRVITWMEEQGHDCWEGRLSDIEPDFNRFAGRFLSCGAHYDPDLGRFGRWLNPLGRWDWWELGGRFDGDISGFRRTGTSSEHMISSGPNDGRIILGNVTRTLGGTEPEDEAEIENNVEPVSALLEAARGTHSRRQVYPTALVLPAGACDDVGRWSDCISWRDDPPETRTFLGLAEDADFKAVVFRAYEHFHDHAAAGIAFHF